MSVDYSPELLDLLRQRAGGRCSYCRCPLPNPFAVDHVIPRVYGGSDDPTNLAASCPACNCAKGSSVAANDPHTGLVETLFHPIDDRWDDHFRAVVSVNVGRSARGRATAALLFRRTPQSLFPDHAWWALGDLRDEGLRSFWATQHARRLSNRFAELERALAVGPNLAASSAQDRGRSSFLRLLVRNDMRSMRCTERDLRTGTNAYRELVRLAQTPADIEKTLQLQISMLGQLATVHEVRGDIRSARQLRVTALRFDSVVTRLAPSSLHAEMRSRQLAGREDVGRLPVAPYSAFDLDRAIEEAPYQSTMTLPYIASIELALPRPSKLFDRVLRAVDDIAQSCGYGQDFDLARGHVLRRRWWGLRAHSGELDEDLLAREVRSWRRVGFRNEIRELELLLSGATKRRPSIRSAVEIVRHVRLGPVPARVQLA